MIWNLASFRLTIKMLRVLDCNIMIRLNCETGLIIKDLIWKKKVILMWNVIYYGWEEIINQLMHILKVKIFNYILEDILISETHLLYQNKSCIIGNEKVIAVSFNFFQGPCWFFFLEEHLSHFRGRKKKSTFISFSSFPLSYTIPVNISHADRIFG